MYGYPQAGEVLRVLDTVRNAAFVDLRIGWATFTLQSDGLDHVLLFQQRVT